MMNGLGLAVARNAIKRVHKRTGNLARSIEVTSVTDDRVTIGAKAAYARFEEEGTRGGQLIVPVRGKALRFAASAAGQRLSGSARRGAGVVFRRSVRRGATPAHPFLEPAARDTIRDAGMVTDSIVALWNKAD
jgi:HK97 gp10 family phage protein